MEINNPSKGDLYPNYLPIHTKTRSFSLTILLVALLITLTGCVTFNDPETSQEIITDTVGILDNQTSIGQTFISRRPLLNGITIWLTSSTVLVESAGDSTSHSVTIRLFHSPGDNKPVFTTSILAPSSSISTPVTIQIPKQSNAPGQSYYLHLTNDSGYIQVIGRNEDAYPNGQAYLDGQPINADIAFRLSYDYDFIALIHDITQGLSNIWLVFPLLIILWLPGWLLLEFSGLRTRFDYGEQTSIAMGISLALIPLIMLWTTILNIKWTKSGIFVATGILITLLSIRLIQLFITSKNNKPKQEKNTASEELSIIGYKPKQAFFGLLTLILIFLLTLLVRMIMVRDLTTPAWVDSVHHALIIRLIGALGSFPSTYLPYWEMPPTAYHPGFHTIAAVFTWLTNLDLAQGLLILGQVLNASAVFSVYLLSKTLTRSTTVGLLAAIITGFLTPMPAYYTSWGRYTELTGLLILPATLALIQVLANDKVTTKKIWIIILGAIVSGGLFMVHYRVIVFLACLILSYLGIYWLGKKGNAAINPRSVLVSVSIMAVLAVFFVIPWLYQMITSTVLPMLNSSIGSMVPFFSGFTWEYITSALGKFTLILAGLGLVWGMIKREEFAFMLLTWILLLFFVANLAALRVPGGALVSIASVEIMLFIPISILGGYFVNQLITQWKDILPKQLVNPFMGLIIMVIGSVALIGTRQLVTIINPITLSSRNSDLPAIQWISENIPENETIVINPFAWGYGLYAGSDGGYWISPLSGRPTLPPPVLYGLGNNNKAISDLSQRIINESSDLEAFKELLLSNQLHFIYIGAKGGIISPEKLFASGLFTVLYHEDSVWLFKLKP